MKSSAKMKALVLLAVIGTYTLIIAGTLGVYGCTPNTEEKAEASSLDQPLEEQVVSINWSPNSDCSICHTDQQASTENMMCMAGLHFSQTALNCSSCHIDTNAELSATHEGIDTLSRLPARLKSTGVLSSTCTEEGCHDDESARVVATAEVTFFADSTGRVVNPHDLPSNERHATVQCSDCHKGHEVVLEENYIEICYECHHTQTFECIACHDV
jgi:hypothetical protein